MKVRTSLQDSFDESNAHLFKLGAENIFLGRTASTKEEAIRFAGEQLVKGGYVQPEYVDAMLERKTDANLPGRIHRGAARYGGSERPRAQNRRGVLPVS